ncbi:hypothetical protein LK09_13180 [Microbacterium mangrovi]|uniref:Type VII secretion integral membrane protein EccD n=1 Tax=Microbacterium mangrovi TaxID=1348253 RepID=A0A0B2A6I0_9MICO|nr:hypothetical protein [Microbacterium mangrovi]KHK97202.1 hypothetical protein LK09_13180 [Microbacterium mangrovi]
MAGAEVRERRRVAIVDGAARYELSLPAAVTVGDAAASVGIRLGDARHVLVDARGREVEASALVDTVPDGSVLALVDLAETPIARPVPRTMSAARPVSFAGWMLAAVGVLAVVGAVSTVQTWPAATAELAFFIAFAVAAVVTGALGLASRTRRAELGAASVILIGAAVVWGGALLLGMPPSAAAAITLGAVPVVLRALPALLLDVPDGMFIDYARFQTTRWGVRQAEPPEVGTISATRAHEIADASAGRLLAGTVLLSALAAIAAPIALPGVASNDPFVTAGRIALACGSILALALGARRASTGWLRWSPRAAAAVVLAVSVFAVVASLGGVLLLAGAAVLLVAGVCVAVAVVPVGRGTTSLAWSRFADVVEWLAVVLVLPAGLLAADVLGMLRGMMAG